jgi:hypothetical protein
METIKETIGKVREYIREAKLKEVFNLLKKLGEQLNPQLSKFNSARDVLYARYSHYEESRMKGILSTERASTIFNELIDDVLSLVNRLESGDLMDPLKSSKDKGRIVHNIPPKLELNQEKPFSVRIAKDDAILLENFKLPPNTEPKTLTLSERMKVKLVSTPSDAFVITAIPPDADEVQSIDYDEFTQWDFSIKPR